MPNSLRDVREGEGLSRAALAREARLNERTLKRIEDEEDGHTPTPATMNKLCNALNRRQERIREYQLSDVFPDQQKQRKEQQNP
jgi:transcriptional regulator with XRE-family HTH domain